MQNYVTDGKIKRRNKGEIILTINISTGFTQVSIKSKGLLIYMHMKQPTLYLSKLYLIIFISTLGRDDCASSFIIAFIAGQKKIKLLVVRFGFWAGVQIFKKKQFCLRVKQVSVIKQVIKYVSHLIIKYM